MSWTTITKPSVGDPTKKTAFADAVIDDLDYLKALLDAIRDETVVLNGSFESDTDADGIPDQWDRTLYTGGSSTHDGTDHRHGQYSFKFTSPGGASNGGGYLTSTEFFEVSPLRLLTLKWLMKSSVADVKNEVVLLWYDEDQNASATPSTTIYSEDTNNPTVWTELMASAVPPSDARYAKVRLIGCKNDDVTAGSAWFDGVRVAYVPAFIVLREEQTSGTAGGTFTSGSWAKRTLNTESTDTASICSLSSSQFTLAPGTYEIRARCPAYRCNGHQARLYNTTDSATTILGSSARSNAGSGDDQAQTDSVVQGVFTITKSTVFELQHRCATTRSTDGLGSAASFGTSEVYSEVHLRML